MSNKTQLQTNNEKYASLIDTLRGKSLPTGGEDVTTETNEYTTKLASLETAITALESELQGKASGGSSVNLGTCTVNISMIDGFRMVIYQTVIDGVIQTEYFVPGTTSIILNNVYCSGLIVLPAQAASPISYSSSYNASVSASTDSSNNYTVIAQLNASPGDIINITIEINTSGYH